MALTLLPEEVLKLIVNHLSVKDLLACSAVSLTWRERFNADVFWGRFCLKSITEFLEKGQSVVEPVFMLPSEKEERLQALCEWRICYMKQTHLINNWKAGNYLTYDFRPYKGVLSAEVKIDFEGTHWLFIITASELEIWNINNDPILHGTIALFPDCNIINIYLEKEYVLVTQWNILSTYDLRCKGPFIKAKSRFILEEDKSLPPTLWETTDESVIKLIKGGYESCYDLRYSHFGNMIVGYQHTNLHQCDKRPDSRTHLTMHIWEISTGEKIRSESIFLFKSERQIATVISKIDDEKGLITSVCSDAPCGSQSQVLVYDFKKLKLKDIKIINDELVIWCGCKQNIIVMFTISPLIIKFFSYSSGKLLAVKVIEKSTIPDTIQLVDSYLLYFMSNCLNVLDIHKKEVIYCVKFSLHVQRPSSLHVQRLSVMESRFITVWLDKIDSQGCFVFTQEVWDTKDFKLLQSFRHEGFKINTLNPSPIKQVISSNVSMSICTFW